MTTFTFSVMVAFASYTLQALAQKQPTQDLCFPRLEEAYNAYNSKGINGLIDNLYTTYLYGTKPGIYCYKLDPVDPVESIVVGTWFGQPTAVPGQVSMSVSASLNKTREEASTALNGWAGYYKEASQLCCGPEKIFYYCSPVSPNRPEGCETTPTYTYTNQTNVGMIVSDDADDADGKIFCACQLFENQTQSFNINEEVVLKTITDAQDALKQTNGISSVLALPISCLVGVLTTLII
jgi:hypothetical protein